MTITLDSLKSIYIFPTSFDSSALKIQYSTIHRTQNISTNICSPVPTPV